VEDEMENSQPAGKMSEQEQIDAAKRRLDALERRTGAKS
jgi:hypothetical protein